MNNDDIQKIIPISPTEKLGFYIGKFDPIHIGHIQLLLDELKYFDKIFLLITDNCITLTTERYNIICNTIRYIFFKRNLPSTYNWRSFIIRHYRRIYRSI